MSEHQRPGPYEDGTYRYRGWTLTLWEDCHLAQGGRRCFWHPTKGEPYWVAEPPGEVDGAGFDRIWAAGNGVTTKSGRRLLERHVAPIPGAGTIEETIDRWEAGRERLFRAALAQAVRDP